jgi:hypothetical protein
MKRLILFFFGNKVEAQFQRRCSCGEVVKGNTVSQLNDRYGKHIRSHGK